LTSSFAAVSSTSTRSSFLAHGNDQRLGPSAQFSPSAITATAVANRSGRLHNFASAEFLTNGNRAGDEWLKTQKAQDFCQVLTQPLGLRSSFRAQEHKLVVSVLVLCHCGNLELHEAQYAPTLES